jgi:hypothetical protein
MFDKENIAIMEEQLDAINCSNNMLPTTIESSNGSELRPRVFSEI